MKTSKRLSKNYNQKELNQSPHLNRDWLYLKYITEELSTYEISKIVNRNPKNIYCKLKDFEIPTRSRAETLKKNSWWKQGLPSKRIGKHHSKKTKKQISEARTGKEYETGKFNLRDIPVHLRKYFEGGSLDWGEHIWKPVIQELFRIVKDGGVVVWVVGDATIKGSETGTSFKQALWAKDCGFNLHDTMIWEKLCYMPKTHNRQEQAFEYMFVWSKGKPKTVNHRMKKNVKSGKVLSGSGFRHNGTDIQPVHGTGNKYANEGIDINIWRYKVGWNHSYSEEYLKGHPAIFPYKLAEDHIKVWSNEGDTILDPFAGSGTVGKMAKQLNRNCILIEKEPEYIKIAEKRINENI